MKNRIPILCLLVSSGVACFYVILRVGSFLPRFFEVAYKLKSTEVVSFMHTPTRLASGHSWGFAFLLAVILAFTCITLNRHPLRALQIAVVGLCAQGIVFWAAMFCFCYEGFCGPVSVHSGAQFSFVEFVKFEGGVFPVTLLGILIPVVAFGVFGSPGKANVDLVSHQKV